MSSLSAFLLILALCHLTLVGTQGTQSPCPRAVRVNSVNNYRSSLHFVCLQAATRRLEVIDLGTRTIIMSQEVDQSADSLVSFVDDGGNLRILVSNPLRINGTSMFSIDYNGNFIDETHTLNTQLVSTMSIWKLELNWEWQLAIANQPTYESLIGEIPKQSPIPEPKPIVSIHSWRATYFDSYQRIELAHDGNINKLEPLRIGDMEFLFIAMNSKQIEALSAGNRSRAHQSMPVNSFIYRLDFGDGQLNWVPYQTIRTKSAIDARSFSITHRSSLHVDHFIAVLGQMDYGHEDAYAFHPRNNQTDASSHGLIIFKFLGDQFVRTHFVPTIAVTKLDAITYGLGDSNAIIALLSGLTNQVELYRFDGLELVKVPVQIGQTKSLRPYDIRNRRTMDGTNNIHLFLMPPSKSQEIGAENDTAKRTLETSQSNQPAVALSLFDSSDYDEADISTTSIHFIPTSNQIENQDEPRGEGQDQAHQKRNFVGPDLYSWCKATINSILADEFMSSSKKLAALPRVDQMRPIELYGDLIIEDDLRVSNLLYANKILELGEIQRVELTHPDMPQDFSETFNQIQATHLEIDRMKRQVDSILVDDGSVQEVFTPLAFETVVLKCPPIYSDPRLRPVMGFGCPHVDEIRTIVLNNRDISDIANQALVTGRSMTIKKDVRFEHLVLHGSVKILGTLNGIQIADIVFGRGPSSGQITGHKHFRNGLFSNAKLNVISWNGIGLNRTNFLTSSGYQRIESGLRFSQVIFDQMGAQAIRGQANPRIEYLNGLHLDSHLAQIAVMDAPNKFETPLHFDELIINGNLHFKEGSHLSSIHMENLWNNVMFKNSHQNISFPVEFAGEVHMAYGADIVVDGLINGAPFATSNLVMRDQDYVLPNPVIFDYDISVRNLWLEKALNGIQVYSDYFTHRSELAILYDGDNQLITSDKVLGEVQLGGQSFITGNINGNLNLSQLHDLAINYGGPHRFSNIKLAANNIRVAETAQITITSTINGIPINEICSLANRLASSQIQQAEYNRLRFEQPIEFKSLRCASINGFNNLTNFFLTRYGNQRVAGTLRLLNGAIFNTTVNIRSRLNNMSVGPMSMAVNRAITESRTGQRDVYGDLWLDDLYATRINDLRLDSIFLARSDYPQLLRAPLVFDHLDIENVLVIGRNLVANSFNGLNVTDLLTNTLQYDAPQIIYNHVQLNTLQLLPGSNLITNSLNGHDMRRLYADAVLVDSPQQIIAPKTFRGSVDFVNRLEMKYGIDGLTEAELRFNLLLHGDELIDDDLVFENDVVIKGELDIQTGIINDIDINMFVDSMIYEERPDKKGMRILGNGSVRFHDVKLNNLVVAGTIQGLDLSREAILQGDNHSSSYESRIKEQQILNNNRRLLYPFRENGANFRVSSSYNGENLMGNCHIHSCLRTTPLPGARSPAPMPPMQSGSRGMNFINVTKNQHVTVWRPRPVEVVSVKQKYDNRLQLIDSQYYEHKQLLRAQAIKDLTTRVNRFLSISFYYEIVQKHPLLGPLLHATSNRIYDEDGGAMLFLKATSKMGEPCLQREQAIAIMSQHRRVGNVETFSQSSLLQETSYPIAVETLIIGHANYLFVLDTNIETDSNFMSQILIYVWDTRSAMYELKDRIMEHGMPTAMKAFRVNDLGCLAVATPKVLHENSNGAPALYCQRGPLQPFNNLVRMPVNNVFDLDVMTIPRTTQVIVATLSQQDTEQIGDLKVHSFDVLNKSFHSVAVRRTVRPLKLHLFRDRLRPTPIQLAVSEGIMSNDGVQTITRIFSLRVQPGYSGPISTSTSRFYETQVIRDNQFYDIQSVSLDTGHSLLFMQSSHSISIYAPTSSSEYSPNELECDPRYALVQRLPTKGANKFLVFNDNNSRENPPYAHFLVLSKEDCEHQQFSTVILKSKFKTRG